MFPCFWLFCWLHDRNKWTFSSDAHMETPSRHGCPCICWALAEKPDLSTQAPECFVDLLNRPRKSSLWFPLAFFGLSVIHKFHHLYFLFCEYKKGALSLDFCSDLGLYLRWHYLSITVIKPLNDIFWQIIFPFGVSSLSLYDFLFIKV